MHIFMAFLVNTVQIAQLHGALEKKRAVRDKASWRQNNLRQLARWEMIRRFSFIYSFIFIHLFLNIHLFQLIHFFKKR